MTYSVLFSNDILSFFPEIFLVFSTLILMVYGVSLAASNNYNYPLILREIYYLTIFILGLSVLLTYENPIDSIMAFRRAYINDDLTRIAKLFLLSGSICSIVLSQNYLENVKINNFEYYLLILFSILGLMLLISSFDLVSAYLAIELQALSFYVLAAFQRRSVYSTEAGLKYFILGSLSSGLMLFGFTLIYGYTGCTTLLDIKNFGLSQSFDQHYSMQLALILVMTAFLFKIAAFPFHMWSPDVYEGSPISTTIFFATVPKLALFCFFVRFFVYSFPNSSDLWGQLVLFSAVTSILYGAFLALKQNSMKRLLAYSGISHAGFMLLPLATNNINGIQSLFLYSLVYIITSLPIWGVVVGVMGGKKESQDDITNLSALAITSPLLAFIGALSLFSLAGIPPLVGFYSKLYVFASAIQGSFYLSAFFVLAISVVSTYYYISLVKSIYFEYSTSKNWLFYNSLGKGESLVLALGLIFMIFFFVNPSALVICSQKMAFSLA